MTGLLVTNVCPYMRVKIILQRKKMAINNLDKVYIFIYVHIYTHVYVCIGFIIQWGKKGCL